MSQPDFVQGIDLLVDSLPHGMDYFVVAGDVSATNILMGVFGIKKDENIPIAKVSYLGQKVTDFGMVLDHLKNILPGQINIENMVLGLAGPVENYSSCRMTNASFAVDLTQHAGYAANMLLLNDFEEICEAVARAAAGNLELKTAQLRHSDGKYGNIAPKGPILVEGAGTGLGVGFLIYDPIRDYYRPIASEGGHVSLAAYVNDFEDMEIVRFIFDRYYGGKNPDSETLLSGSGIVRIFSFFREEYSIDNMPKYKSSLEKLDALEDDQKPRHIVTQAIENPGSYFEKTVVSFWRHYGTALRDSALSILPRGGVYIAGGIIRKDLGRSELMDDLITTNLMREFETHHSPNSRALLQTLPIYAILDKEAGLKGALAVATTPELMQEYLAKQQGK
jgi:glucokinase